MQPGVTIFSAVIAACGGQASTGYQPGKPRSPSARPCTTATCRDAANKCSTVLKLRKAAGEDPTGFITHMIPTRTSQKSTQG